MDGKDLDGQLSRHIEIIEKCGVVSDRFGRLLLASPLHTRYPYIYPRDTSSAMTLLRRIAASGKDYKCAGRAFKLMESAAQFMKAVCRNGYWGQRYSTQGEDKSIYKQEDNIAHGIAIICNYLLAARKTKAAVPGLDGYLKCVDEAAAYSLKNLYHPELNLFHSTTAIHESAIEEGFTCWTNFSFLYAFSLLHEVATLIDEKKIISRHCLDFRRHFLYSVGELFIARDRFVRRINVEGHFDLRPDITLMSPFYFGFCHYKTQIDNSIDFLEKHLWDSELGMIMRYLPFQKDFAVHIHAGHGPWLQYTAILAQYHYWNENPRRGDELLRMIDSYKSAEDEIPEHLSTWERFERFMETEWQTGIDFAKEFHQPLLLDGVRFDTILEEANNMATSYRDTEKRGAAKTGSGEPGYIRFATPLMWAHVEYARALLFRAGDWWKLHKKN